MKSFQILAGSIGLVVASSDAAATSAKNPSIISYRCNDIVILGTLQNVLDSYKHLEIEDDILGHGWMTAFIRVKRVISGKEVPSTVYAEYFGHTYFAFAPRKSYLVVLRSADGGGYTAATIRRWNSETKSSLDKSCT